MSYEAMRFVADSRALNPLEKLVLFQLAAFQNPRTGQCNPSPATIAEAVKLPVTQVKGIVDRLIDAGRITRGARGFEFPGQPRDAKPIPRDFWPTDAVIDAILAAYPNHDFDMKEAVNDFIEYASRAGITARDPNRAFERNICTLLDRRKPGKVRIGIEADGNGARSVGAFLSGGLHGSTDQ